MMLHDRAPIERIRRLADGRVAAVAKFARTGCYTYAGSEVGRPDLASVTVYRDEAEVFSEDAMASFGHKAITLGHPPEGVTAANWKRVSVGFTEGRVARDGGFVEIPLMLADASAVEALDRGERELSAGYSCQLIWGDGVAPDGTKYQAKQTKISGDHIAIVPSGRAGGACRLGDAATNDSTFITDAERGDIIAYARSVHSLTAGRTGGPFTDAMAKEAVEREVAARRHRGANIERLTHGDADAAGAEAAAYTRMVDRLSGHRKA